MIKTELIKLFEKIGNETDTFAPFITCDEFENLADEIIKLCNLHIVSKRLILENLRERMQGVYPEYYLSIIDDEIEGLNGC